jgi:hypothetical protein
LLNFLSRSDSSVKFPATETRYWVKFSSRPLSKHYQNWNPKIIDALGVAVSIRLEKVQTISKRNLYNFRGL